MNTPVKTLHDFNQEYLRVHTQKEDQFWKTYMAIDPESEGLEKAESAYKAYISDPARIQEARGALAAENDPERKKALEGWLNFFSSHSIENPAAQKLQAELIALEAQIYRARSKLKLEYRDSQGKTVEGSTNVMASNLSASSDETIRKTSHEALLRLEQEVLRAGFLDLVRKRNEFARALGFKNYFVYRIYKNERLTETELFAILDEFEALTRDTCFKQLEDLKKRKGPDAVLGHNIKFAVAGDAEQKLNPYFPFKKSLERWCRSFARLGIGYRGAMLTLDLFDRKGKYENGFMHGPEPCFFDGGKWNPARINFTSNATPNQVGSGKSGLFTLFHEGGHAAHFSNITQNAPCFSQEFPPTSMAYAETQSMFLDSLVGDADWMKLYARDASGNEIPDEVIRLSVTMGHPFRAFAERSILVVPVFESRLYSLPESELTPERVTALARQCEKEVQGVECSPRPLMAIPHLLGGDSACSYQGYLLAHMAVYQTRAHFLSRYGYLADNPKIGPELEKHYWNPGNSLSHQETIRSLTGQGLSGRELANYCNLSTDELWKLCEKKIAEARARAQAPTSGELDAKIRIIHGAETIASNQESMERMWSDFESWIDRNFPAKAGNA